MTSNYSISTAQKLLSKGLFNAGNAVLSNLIESKNKELVGDRLAELYFEQGKISLKKDANYKEAVANFTKAIENTDSKESRVKYTIYLGFAYRKMSEFDTCNRYLMEATNDLEDVSPLIKGLLFGNLSAIQGINGFYAQALDSIAKSADALSDSISSENQAILYNNSGLAYLELGEYDKAELYLKKAMEFGGKDFIEPLSEIGRLCLLQGRIGESIKYAEHALDVIWSSIINYNKDELALLCNLLANIAVRINEKELAIRLGEKAQVFFGQLGMWRQWQNIESQLEEWQEELPEQYTGDDADRLSLKKVQHFMQCLEAMNSQELIHKKVSKLLDVRVYYAQIFARELELSEQEQENLVLASRFADYGLTALEYEVIMEPTRSEVAFEQYKQHPSLSVRMAKTLNLTDSVTSIIEDHHENYDGSGYSKGKNGEEIHYLARVFSVIDKYSNEIVLKDRNHFEVLADIVNQSGSVLDPTIVSAFEKMFETVCF